MPGKGPQLLLSEVLCRSGLVTDTGTYLVSSEVQTCLLVEQHALLRWRLGQMGGKVRADRSRYRPD